MTPPNGGISGFRTVDLDRQQVVAGLQVRREPGLERRIAILVRGDLNTVQIDHTVGHGSIENQRDFFALETRLPGNHLLVGKSLLIALLVEIVVGQLDRRMGSWTVSPGCEAEAKAGSNPARKIQSRLKFSIMRISKSYFTEPSMPCTNWRCMAKKTRRVGRVARIVPIITVPYSGE